MVEAVQQPTITMSEGCRVSNLKDEKAPLLQKKERMDRSPSLVFC